MYCVPITKSRFREKILNKGNKKIFVCWAHSEADSQDKGLALRYAPPRQNSITQGHNAGYGILIDQQKLI